MNFSINQKSLSNLLSIVNMAVYARPTSPALAGAYIEANENEVTVRTTDLELSIQMSAPALIEEEGSALLPAKLLGNIVNTLPDEAVCISTTDERATINCGKSSFDIRVLSKQEFPDFPELDAIQSLSLPFDDFSQMVKKVARMVSKDETRAILQGVNIAYDGQTLEMIATDAYRIAVASKEISIPGVDSFDAVIPGNFLLEVAGLSDNIKEVAISLSQNQVLLNCGDIVFINRRIEGNFPAYQQLVNDDYVLSATINNNDLKKAVRRVAVMSMDSPVINFSFDASLGTVVLSSDKMDIGNAEESLEVKIEEGPAFSNSDVASGEPFAIKFNGNYVTDGLSSVESEDVSIELTGDIKPGIFKDNSSIKLTYILLPIRPN